MVIQLIVMLYENYCGIYFSNRSQNLRNIPPIDIEHLKEDTALFQDYVNSRDSIKPTIQPVSQTSANITPLNMLEYSQILVWNEFLH